MRKHWRDHSTQINRSIDRTRSPKTESFTSPLGERFRKRIEAKWNVFDMRAFTVIRASLLVGPTRHGDHYYCNACSIMSLPDGVMLPVMHRVTNDESAGFARMPTWDDYSGPRKITAGTYVGPMVEPSTWAVITASAVRRTVTHVNAHRGSKAAILAPEKLLFRLALSEKCLPRDEVKEEEIPRELAEFIPAISARRARRFDARTDLFREAETMGTQPTRAMKNRVQELGNKM